jgi:hypothetical protein
MLMSSSRLMPHLPNVIFMTAGSIVFSSEFSAVSEMGLSLVIQHKFAASRRLSACRQTEGGLVNRCVFRSRCRRAIMIHWRRNRPAVGCPPYVCQHVLVLRSNLFGSITHRGGRDTRVPVRAALRQAYMI